ncbi:hypothetical protein HNV12_16260 [Methanococcoides sp. SA1]|nr:hypothetical protein [Methanococcoides sp. SA1]
MIDQNYLQIYSLYKLDSIEGNLKFEKVCFELKESLIENGYKCGDNFEFKRDNFGPRSPGLSKANLKFEMMDLLEIEKELEKKTTTYVIKEKGKIWIEGLNKFYTKTVPDFQKILNISDKSLEENKDLSGSKIVKKDKVQKAKKELFGKKV